MRWELLNNHNSGMSGGRELTSPPSKELIYSKTECGQSLLFSSYLFARHITLLSPPFLPVILYSIQSNRNLSILTGTISLLFLLSLLLIPSPPSLLLLSLSFSLSLSRLPLRCIAQSVGEARVSPLALPRCLCLDQLPLLSFLPAYPFLLNRRLPLPDSAEV